MLRCTIQPPASLNAILGNAVVTAGGEPQVKEVTITETPQEITPDAGFASMSKVVATVPLEEATITENGEHTPHELGYKKVVVDVRPRLQAKPATPATTQFSVTPDAGFDGLSKVDVAAVTSAIDPNITAGNIKDGVSVLGVEGSYKGEPLIFNNEPNADLTYVLRPSFIRVILPEVFEISLPYCANFHWMFGNLTTGQNCYGAKHIIVHGSQNGLVTSLYGMFGRGMERQSSATAWDCPIETITLDFDMSNVIRYDGFFSADRRDLLQAIYGTFDFSSVDTDANALGFNVSFASLTHMRFAPNTLHVNFKMSGASALDSASLISLANCLQAGLATPLTLTLHADAKTNCNSIYVTNEAGLAVVSDSSTAGAMTLTTFITIIKGWTIA